jgi:hypothetical protein
MQRLLKTPAKTKFKMFCSKEKFTFRHVTNGHILIISMLFWHRLHVRTFQNEHKMLKCHWSIHQH